MIHKHLQNSSTIDKDDYHVLIEDDRVLAITAYNNEHEKISDLVKPISDFKGIDTFLIAYEKAQKINAYYLVVYELKTNKSPISRPLAKYQIFVKPNMLEDNELDKTVEQNFQTPNFQQYSSEEFNGLGGLGELLNVKEKLYQNEFEKQRLSYENEQLRKDKADLQNEVKDLDKENDELNGALNKSIEEIERLKKYEPNGSTIFGFSPVHLGGAILERAVKNIAIKNPQATKGLLGIDDGQFNSFFGESVSIEASNNQPTPQVSFDDYEEDVSKLTDEQKAHLEVSRNIYDWLKKIDSQALHSIATILEHLQKDMGKAQNIIQILTQKQ